MPLTSSSLLQVRGFADDNSELSADELFSQAASKEKSASKAAFTPDSPFAPLPNWKNVPGPKGPRQRQPDEAWARLGNIPTSMKKLVPVCKMIRGLTFYQARAQMQLSVKGSAPFLLRALDSARANAEHNHGLDVDRLYVSESYCTRGSFRKGIRYHGRGRAGMVKHPFSHYVVILKEWPEGQEKPPLIGRRGWKQRKAERAAVIEQERLKRALNKVKANQENPPPKEIRKITLNMEQ